jgi:UDP-glucose 4-epimerase
MNILLTGGAGYIGSHTAVVLSQAGHNVVLLDNFCNSQKSILGRLQKILGKALPCVEGDVRDAALVLKILQDYKIDGVAHFAGLKAVGQSAENPIDYFDNNICGAISLLQSMRANNTKTLVFSSSAAMYGAPKYLPVDESHPIQAVNPYGRSKIHIEQILEDTVTSDPTWRVVCLRYFNPAGTHDSALIGEDPNGLPNNLIPYIAQVASGKLPYLNVYGNDYDTPDGTGVRDYIHIMDLAEGHLAAFNFIINESGMHIFNLGTGKGNSVLEIIKAYEDTCINSIPYKYMERRNGDVAACYAKVNKASDGFKLASNANNI